MTWHWRMLRIPTTSSYACREFRRCRTQHGKRCSPPVGDKRNVRFSIWTRPARPFYLFLSHVRQSPPFSGPRKTSPISCTSTFLYADARADCAASTVTQERNSYEETGSD